MPNRREFLLGLAASGLVSPAQILSFTGSRPGDERDVAGIRLCWCPPGQFVMGSPAGETGRRPDEGQVNVTLTRGFWIAKFEVTQFEWRRIAGSLPERPPTARFGQGDDVPIYWVSYLDAEAFCACATSRARKRQSLPEPWAFRIPTEAQWEYACRAGTTTLSAFGDRLGRKDANFGSGPLNGGEGGPSPGKSLPAGSYPANAWGIHDMHGNVWEWCRDWYHGSLPGGVDRTYRTPEAPRIVMARIRVSAEAAPGSKTDGHADPPPVCATSRTACRITSVYRVALSET